MEGLGHILRSRNFIYESIAFRRRFPCDLPQAALPLEPYGCQGFESQTVQLKIAHKGRLLVGGSGGARTLDTLLKRQVL